MNLTNFKHEQTLKDIDHESWYIDHRHPQLHILDNLDLQHTPEILFREGNEIVYIEKEGNAFLKHQINIDTDHLY